MRKVIVSLLLVFTSCISLSAQEIRRGGCTPDLNVEDAAPARGAGPRQLRAINTKWDSTRVYRQAVILISYSDTEFQMEHPRETYDSIFNFSGYNQRKGPGCAAEYFREQSRGLFNLKFDVYGPVKVKSVAQPYANPTEKTRNYARNVLEEATKYVVDSMNVDFTPYDWNNDGKVEQVIYICAGYTGNQSSTISYGHIWPNTASFTKITTPSGKSISNYTASAEMWINGVSCGIGTVIHEYTHSLGLPDIYPTSDNGGYSVVDEWDLMDGGNFTNYGWCPPNYTPLEKMLLGWIQPVELVGPQTVRNLKSIADGGDVYRIKHSDNEWLLLENRQQKGWDYGLPGKGLVIFHVNYDSSSWTSNAVNANKQKRRFNLVNADNMDYDSWVNYVMTWEKHTQYQNSGRMNSNLLSTSPYPWFTDSTTFVNNSLTDNSVPPAKMNEPNSEGSLMLSKSITNIVQNADGTITFDFMADMAKCATPTILYENGRIHFQCDTEGVKFVSKVTAPESMEGEGDDLALATRYTITVYAVAEGYADSDTVTGTLTLTDEGLIGENIEVISKKYRDADVNKDGFVDVADISAVITTMANE